MVKRVYEKISVTAKAGKRTSVQHRLRSDYQRASGLFFHVPTATSTIKTDNLYCSVRIANQEVVPDGTAVDMFLWQPGISRNEAMWDFSDGGIPANTSLFEAEFDNQQAYDIDVNIYVLVENY